MEWEEQVDAQQDDKDKFNSHEIFFGAVLFLLLYTVLTGIKSREVNCLKSLKGHTYKHQFVNYLQRENGLK